MLPLSRRTEEAPPGRGEDRVDTLGENARHVLVSGRSACASARSRALSRAARSSLSRDRGAEKVDRRHSKRVGQPHQALERQVLQPEFDLLKVFPGQPQFLGQGLLGQALLRTQLGYSPANIGDHVFCVESAGTQGAPVSLARLDETPAYSLVLQRWRSLARHLEMRPRRSMESVIKNPRLHQVKLRRLRT
jgi:hypothetical protein